jgi:hypothetical protein
MRITFLTLLTVATGGTASLYGVHAQADEPKIVSREKVGGWGAAPPITKRTADEAIAMLKRQKKLKPGDRINVEEEMPKRLPPIYLTIHHVGHSLSGSTIQDKLSHWQKNMQGSYNFQKTDRNGKAYTFHAVPGDIPYHFVVAENGDIAVGRELKFGVFSNTTYLDKPRKHMTPAELSALSAELRNRTDPPMLLFLWRNKFMPHHITVVLEGDFEGDKKKEGRKLEGAQRDNLVALLVKLAKEHHISPDHITYHKDASKEGTPCPGKNVIAEMDKLRQKVAERLE